ncbi:acetoacetate decarboxylase family protein [Arthrobacter sp. StoSoilB5]|uniref:acetoacetate decarboxylase family protein n=1 Tax=Arthrobacter sp. StoSoilB5 TaxID=2830992 RepID=UPI001CC4CDE6|nr:acetoacetate decarboxylase family protein [Arthrobacter sp. StoSoilB5]BCW44860.1 acetoacetate decarboxylase [Arthrobacter sp. StoSoilB5]
MTEPSGFLFPRSPEGRASLIPPPPWYYAATAATIEYRTNPDNVRALLPEQLALDEDDPGLVAMVFTDVQSCSEGGEELLDPIRSQYGEALLAVKARYRGVLYTRIAYVWVTRDFSLGRGIHMGYPKKIGSVHMTRPFPYGRAPRVEPGGRFGASLAAADHRLAEARFTLREQVDRGPSVTSRPLLHSRLLRSIEIGGADSLDELVVHSEVELESGRPWAADAELRLFESPVDELAALSVDEIVGAYYQQGASRWEGGILLSAQLSAERPAGP